MVENVGFLISFEKVEIQNPFWLASTHQNQLHHCGVSIHHDVAMVDTIARVRPLGSLSGVTARVSPTTMAMVDQGLFGGSIGLFISNLFVVVRSPTE